ncbi:hypothetical protein VO63_22270 [Streptomyces showdoensis]|uniref:Uncharacterized protein n=1 Tax=Streptomyces showdoensis TaxID=68268 RepID=A0A2P2GJM5_STREW|nr:hypothetical protein VO63_22270 [Streptomyces showdoensis]
MDAVLDGDDGVGDAQAEVVVGVDADLAVGVEDLAVAWTATLPEAETTRHPPKPVPLVGGPVSCRG